MGLVGLPLSFVGFGKTSSTSGISSEEESAGHHVVHLVVHIYNWGMLLPLGTSRLPRHRVPLVGNVWHFGMGLPSLAIGGSLLCLP